MTFAKRTDKNQQEIMDAMRKMGASVTDLSKVGKGCPDLLVGINQKTALVEIKSSSKAKYTIHQEKWLEAWKGGTVARIDSIDSAIQLIKILSK